MNTLHDIPRSAWLRAWSALPAAQIKTAAASMAERYRIDDLALCQSGLGLLPLRDSALGDPYFLGEIPLAQAHVRISDQHGTTAEGAAILLDDRASLARAMAILDGVLAARLPGFEAALDLLQQGTQKIVLCDQQRRALLAATRVDFSLFGTSDDDDDV